jgi:hypothetical protein
MPRSPCPPPTAGTPPLGVGGWLRSSSSSDCQSGASWIALVRVRRATSAQSVVVLPAPKPVEVPRARACPDEIRPCRFRTLPVASGLLLLLLMGLLALLPLLWVSRTGGPITVAGRAGGVALRPCCDPRDGAGSRGCCVAAATGCGFADRRGFSSAPCPGGAWHASDLGKAATSLCALCHCCGRCVSREGHTVPAVLFTCDVSGSPRENLASRAVSAVSGIGWRRQKVRADDGPPLACWAGGGGGQGARKPTAKQMLVDAGVCSCKARSWQWLRRWRGCSWARQALKG